VIAYYGFQGIYFCKKVTFHSPHSLLAFGFSNGCNQIYFLDFSDLGD